MVTATCRLCQNSAIIDPTVAEIVAHQTHPHHHRRANPYWCPVRGIRHKGQLYDPAHLCRPHRQQIDGSSAHPGALQEAAAGIAAGTGSAGDAGFDSANTPAMERLPSFRFERQAKAVERHNILSERQ